MEKEKEFSADEVINGFCEKLDTMLNGDVVNDTMIRHFKKVAQNMDRGNESVKAMLKSGVDRPERDWILFAMIMMSAGPLPEEEITDEFKEGMERFAKEHGIEEKYIRVESRM